MSERKPDSKRQSLRKRRYSAFLANRKGASAVEFALIAFPFFVLIFGLIEITMMFLLSTTLDYGVSEAARRIRTGEIQTSATATDATGFKELVCGNLFGLMDCDEKLFIDVKTYASFSNSDKSLPLNEDGEMQDSFDFSMGGSSEIVMVRAYYQWEMLTPVLSAPLSNMTGGKRLLASTAVFKNEPF